MVGSISQSPGLTSAVVWLENGEVAGCIRKARRSMATTPAAGVAGVNLRASSGSSCSASRRGLQKLTGFRAQRRRSWDLSFSESFRRVGRNGVQASFEPLDLTSCSNAYGRITAPRLQDLDPNTMLLLQRIIFLGGQVEDFSADVIISQMLLLDAQDPTKDIKLFINSPGGSVTAGMGIYDAIKLCRADVSTTCFGLAASMGAFLLAAGAKGKRYCMPNDPSTLGWCAGIGRLCATFWQQLPSDRYIPRSFCVTERPRAKSTSPVRLEPEPCTGRSSPKRRDFVIPSPSVVVQVKISAIEVGLQVREMMHHKRKLSKIMARLMGQTEEQIDIDTDRDNFMNAWEAVEYGLVDHVIDDGKPGLVAPIGEVKEPPKSRVWDYWTVKEGKERKSLPTEEVDFHEGKRFGDRKEDEVEESKRGEKVGV